LRTAFRIEKSIARSLHWLIDLAVSKGDWFDYRRNAIRRLSC
jgi:hypothetical protein